MAAENRPSRVYDIAFILFYFLVSVTALTHEEFQAYPRLSKRVCPSSVHEVGDEPADWPLVHNMDTFLRCSHIPRLFTAGLNISVDNTYFHAVTSLRGDDLSMPPDYEGPTDSSRPMTQTNVTLQGARTESSEGANPGQAIAASLEMAVHLSHRAASEKQGEKPTILFSQYGKTAVGFFGGSHVDLSSIIRSVLHSLVAYLREEGPGRTLLFQVCGDRIDRRRTVGVIVDTGGGSEAIDNVHASVSMWNQAQCVSGLETQFTQGNRTLWMVPNKGPRPEPSQNGTQAITGAAQNETGIGTALPRRGLLESSRTTRNLRPRAECTAVKVVPGDSCGTLGKRCGVSDNDFLKVNPASDFCSALMPDELVCCNAGDIPTPKANSDGTCRDIKAEPGDDCWALAAECETTLSKFEEFNGNDADFCGGLMAGQWVCCTPGDLPDHSPKPNADGSCATHTVTGTDQCWQLAQENEMTVDQLEEYNQGKTWGWSTCEMLYPDTLICLSPGDPPMPLPMPPDEDDVMCGPRKRGTETPPKGTDISTLNPCPLNACCNGWGWCGTTDEFCVAPDGEPVTAANSEKCISNCGTGIISSGTTPDQFMSIAYFEAWNGERPCLWMDVESIDTSRHTHIHYAFGRVTAEEYAVDVSATQTQFDKFVKMSGVKRVLSFGGWADSTMADRSFILREALSEGREKFANNVVNFIIEHDLDGLDIDWEYPGAKDIDGIVPDARDGGNYLDSLKLLRSLLPADKTLAIATPASFWYLQNFPISEMAEYLDYIVYMTYDLHGQWDYGGKHGQVGCPNGDCLRSHVNLTETSTALSMITKAGVPSHKIIVGVSSYGRSFRLAEAGCTGPECKYVGPDSAAKRGFCTGEAGYISDAEINRIIEDGTSTPWELEEPSKSRTRAKGVQAYYDENSHSDILVYDDLEWVSYMSETTKQTRRLEYKSFNFGGITDWAVDLQEFSPDEYLTPYVMEQIDEGGECIWKFSDGVDCLVDGLQDTMKPMRVRWNSVGTDCAWRFVKAEWRSESDASTDLSFPRFVSDLLDGPEAFDCDVISGNGGSGCTGTRPLCTPFQTVESGPAAMFITQSFMRIHSILGNLYGGVIDAQTSFLTGMPTFLLDFSPAPPEKEDQVNIIIDMIGIAFSFLGVGMFKALGTEGNRKDLAWNLASWGGSLIKDIPRDGDNPLDREGIVTTALHHLQNGLKDQFEEFTKFLFSGEVESLGMLDGLLSEGKSIQGGDSNKSDKDRKSFEDANTRLLHAWIIPTAWSAAERRPVVIDAGDCEAGAGDYKWLTAKTASETGGCVDGRKYFLVTTGTEWKSETPNCFCESPCQGGPPPCWDEGYTNYLLAPPGNDRLREEGGLAGLTQADMLNGAVNTWKHNGKKNTEDPVKVDQDLLNEIYDPSSGEIQVSAPGIVRVPVCDADEAYGNWEKGADATAWHYPCNAP